MTLSDRIDTDLKEAMRSRDLVRIGTLRMLRTAISGLMSYGQEMTRTAGLALLLREIRIRRDSIELYRSGGRGEAADEIAAELELVKSCLPELMNDDEIRARVLTVVEETGATGLKDLTAVRERLSAEIGGCAGAARMDRFLRDELVAKEKSW